MGSVCLDARGNLLNFCLFVGETFDDVLSGGGEAEPNSVAVANVRAVVACARQEGEGIHTSVQEREDALLAVLQQQMDVTDQSREGGEDAASQFLRRTDGRTQSKVATPDLLLLMEDYCNLSRNTADSLTPDSDLVTFSRLVEATMRVMACAKQAEKDGHISAEEKEKTLALLDQEMVASPSEQCWEEMESEIDRSLDGATVSTCATKLGECATESKNVAEKIQNRDALTSTEHSTRQQDATVQSWQEEREGAVRQILKESDISTCATKLDFSGCATDAESIISRTQSESNTFTSGKKGCVRSDTFRMEQSALVTPRNKVNQRNTQDSNSSDSDTEDRLCARKQKRKEKHQAEKDAAAKKRGRFSATDDVATEDALGVEGVGSALQIARHPPKPSRSKQKQGQKTKRQRQSKSRQVRQNEAKAMTKVGGSRCVLNKDAKSYAGRNECFAKRTCLPDAVAALLPPQLKQRAPDLYAAMPKGKDAAPLDLKHELHCLGLSLERAPEYFKKGHTAAHLLLQERTCKLVIHVHLTDADENIISHFVAWDGSTVIDHPHNVNVNSTSDRSSPTKSQEAFDKLFKRHYKNWQITSVHRLRQRNTQEICRH